MKRRTTTPMLASLAGTLCLVSFLGASASRPVEVDPVPNELQAEHFRSADATVYVAVQGTATRRTVCLWGHVTHERTPTRRVIIQEGGCEPSPDVRVRFDPATWRADVRGSMTVTVQREVQERIDDEWRITSWRARPSRVALDLTWLGEGEIRPEASVRGLPLSCYTLPPICTSVRASISRAAVVSGEVVFDALGITAAAPDQHPGIIKIP